MDLERKLFKEHKGQTTDVYDVIISRTGATSSVIGVGLLGGLWVSYAFVCDKVVKYVL